MTFKLTLTSEEPGNLSAILVDIITSAAYFGKRDIEIEQDNESFTFLFNGHCPNEYLRYLNFKYDLAIDCK